MSTNDSTLTLDIRKGLKGLNLPKFSIIEYPGTIRNFDAAIETLGGTHKVRRTFRQWQQFEKFDKEKAKRTNQKKTKSQSSTNKQLKPPREPFLELHLNPNGVFDHSLQGNIQPIIDDYVLAKIPKIRRPSQSNKFATSNHPKSEMDDDHNDDDDDDDDEDLNDPSNPKLSESANAIDKTVPIEIMGWCSVMVSYDDLCDFQVFPELKYPQKVTHRTSPIRGVRGGNVIRKRRRGQRVWSLRDDDIPNISKYPLVPLVFSAKTQPHKDFMKSSKKKQKKSKKLSTEMLIIKFSRQMVPHLPKRTSIWMKYHKNLSEYIKEGNEKYREIPEDHSDDESDNESGDECSDKTDGDDLDGTTSDRNTGKGVNDEKSKNSMKKKTKTKKSRKENESKKTEKISKKAKSSKSKETKSKKASSDSNPFNFCQRIRNELTLQIKSYLQSRPIWMKQELLLQKFYIFWYHIKYFSDKESDPEFDHEIASIIDHRRKQYLLKRQDQSKRLKNADRVYLALEEKERILTKMCNVVSYRFKAGPYRMAIVRLGFDPRDAVNKNIARPLQVMDFRIHKNIAKILGIDTEWSGGKAMKRGKPMRKRKRNEIDLMDIERVDDAGKQEEERMREEERKCKLIMDQMCFRTKPNKINMFYQLRNIDIPKVQEILNNGDKKSFNASCVNEKFSNIGWVLEKDVKGIRELMQIRLNEWADAAKLEMDVDRGIEMLRAFESGLVDRTNQLPKLEKDVTDSQDIEIPAKRRKIDQEEPLHVDKAEDDVVVNKGEDADSSLSDEIDLSAIDSTMAASFMMDAGGGDGDDVFQLL